MFYENQKIFFSLQKSKKHRFNVCNNLKLCLNDCFTVFYELAFILFIVFKEENIFFAFNL